MRGKMTCTVKPSIGEVHLSIEIICDALRDLTLFLQFKKREQHLWMCVTLVKLQAEAPWVFFTFLKLYKWYQIAERISYIVLR